MACLLPTGRRGECGVRESFFSLPTVPTTLVIIFFRKKCYIYHIIYFDFDEEGSQQWSILCLSLPTMSTTSSALSSIVVSSRKKKKAALPLRSQVQVPLFKNVIPPSSTRHFSQPPSMTKH